MTDYTELVKALRCETSNGGDCWEKKCQYLVCGSYAYCNKKRIMIDAAAAIEALNSLLDQNTQRCEELRKQLREAHESYERHLNELEAQLPKRGEWIRKDAELYYWHECSKCGERPLYDRYANKVLSAYCPNCGAKMEVQE